MSHGVNNVIKSCFVTGLNGIAALQSIKNSSTDTNMALVQPFDKNRPGITLSVFTVSLLSCLSYLPTQITPKRNLLWSRICTDYSLLTAFEAIASTYTSTVAL